MKNSLVCESLRLVVIVDGDQWRDCRLEDGPSLGRLISVSVRVVLVSQWLTGLLYHHILSSPDWPEMSERR